MMTLFSGKKIKIARQKATAEFNAGTKYCPIISRNTIIKNSTSENIWQTIHLHFGFQSTGGHFGFQSTGGHFGFQSTGGHFGFQSTGGHFIDFLSISLENGERPVDF